MPYLQAVMSLLLSFSVVEACTDPPPPAPRTGEQWEAEMRGEG